MFCPQCTGCNHVNAPGSNYCTRCGAKLLLAICPTCKALNDATASTCRHCGATGDESGAHMASHSTSSAHGASIETIPFAMDALSHADTASLEAEVSTAEAAPEADHTGGANAWAGSSPAAFTAHTAATSRRRRAVAIIVTLAVAGAAAALLYSYRYPFSMAAEGAAASAQDTRANTTSSTRSSTPEPAPPANAPRGAKGDQGQGCTEAVAALALCSPEAARKH